MGGLLLAWPVEFSPPAAKFLYILYLDESGTSHEASYFVLAGLAVFEREIYWFSQELDNLQLEYFPKATEPIFFPCHKTSC